VDINQFKLYIAFLYFSQDQQICILNEQFLFMFDLDHQLYLAQA
jgi:hypothetical protein